MTLIRGRKCCYINISTARRASAYMPARTLHPAETNYLKAEIEAGIPRRAKVALQQLNRLYRSGARIAPAAVRGMENALLGAMSSGTSDEKVRRWSLSALGLLGSPDACL